MLIPTFDARTTAAAHLLQALRERLSPRGSVVSPRGKQLTQEVFGSPISPVEVVQRICDDVRARGTDSVLEFTRKLDRVDLSAETIRVSAAEMEQAHRQADPRLLESVRRVRDNIARFQTAILHQNVELQPAPGIRLGQRYLPLRRVGVCIPGGAAAYPSTVLMTVVPAQVAGVEELALIAPPTPFGANNPVILATCWELGAREVYRAGGAQGVAALAYGCDAIPAVDKIVGPGNLFVALAKKYVYGQVDIDSIAGPSEVVVIADQTARSDWVAADLLSQAEHSPGSAVLITWNETLAKGVASALEQQLNTLERADLIIDSLRDFSAIILVRDAEQACELTDQFAPEHLHIQTEQPRQLLEKIRNAGAAFLGSYSPVALGDYAAGPSHVLPTGGTARWASGLSANDFLRSGSVIEFTATGLDEIGGVVEYLAQVEGLTAHQRSVSIRR